MEIRFDPYVLDIDIQKTRLFYQKANNVSVDCSCPSCRNFEKAVEILPCEKKYFFDALGINMKKPAEVYANMINDDGLVSYGGFYHLCGRLLSGESAWVTVKRQELLIGILQKHTPYQKIFMFPFKKIVLLWKMVSLSLFYKWTLKRISHGYWKSQTLIFDLPYIGKHSYMRY